MEKFFKNQKYSFKMGIYDFGINDDVTKIVKNFYEETPFPNYKNIDDKASILEIGNKNFLMKNHNSKFKKSHSMW